MKKNKNKLPIAKNEDVEFSRAEADHEDIEALDRSKRADKRQEKK